MAAGSIIIDLLMKTGSFETDTKRAEARLKALRKEAEQAGKNLALGVGVIAAAATGTIAALDAVAGSIAQYQDLADKIGDTASAASGLQLAADLSGTTLDQVAAASVRLTDALAKQNDETKGAGAALKFLNLPLDEFRKLSPVDQLEAVAKALQKVENGADRTAVATALYGRAGAELIPFLNDLAEKGSRNYRLTEDQIGAADRFSKRLAELRSETSTLAKVVAGDLFPALQVVLDQITGGEGKLRDTASIAKFLRGEIYGLAEAYVFLASGIERVGKFAGLGLASAEAMARGRFDQLGDMGAAFREDLSKSEAAYGKFLLRLKTAGVPVTSRLGNLTGGGLNIASPPPPPRAPSFDSGGAPKATKQTVSEAQRYLESLEKQLDRTRDLSTVEQVLSDIQSGRLKLSGNVTQAQLTALASQIDSNKYLTDLRSEENKQLQQFLDLQRQIKDEGKGVYEATRTPIEKLAAAEQTRLNMLLEKGVIDWDTYGRAVFASQDAFDAVSAKVKDVGTELDEFAKNAAQSIQGQIGNGLVDVLSGNFSNIGKNFKQLLIRMAADAAAADLARKLFGKSGGGEGGGLFGAALNAVGTFLGFGGPKATGGPVSGGMAYLVGEKGPEMFVPSTAGAIVPNNALGAVGGDMHVSIVNTGTPQRVTAQQRVSATEWQLIVADAVDKAEARIAGQISDPNSKVSRQLSRNLQAPRNR